MATEPQILQALEGILIPFREWTSTQTDDARAAIAKAMKLDKTAFAPLKPLAKSVTRADEVLQICLETPADSSLHRAATAWLSRADSFGAPMLPLTREKLPSRLVTALALSRDGRHVYAAEGKGGVVSVWSLENGAHLEDLKTGAKVLRGIGETREGGIRVVSIEGDVLERAPGGAKLAKVRRAEAGDLAATDGRWLVDILPDPDSEDEATLVRICDLDTGKTKDVKLAHRVDAACELVRGADAAVVQTAESLEVVDLAKGIATTVPVPAGARVDGYAVESNGAVNVRYTGGGGTKWARFTPATGALTTEERATAADPWDAEARVRWSRAIDWFPDGKRFNARGTTAVHADDGKLLNEYVPSENVNQLVTVIDPKSGRLVVAGRNVAMPVLVLAPFILT